MKMKFSEEKTKTINKMTWRSVGERRLFVYKDYISIGKAENDGMCICRIEDLLALEEACKELRETIESVAQVFY